MALTKFGWGLLIVAIAIPLQVFFAAQAIGGAVRVYQYQREIEVVRAEIARLDARRAELEAQQLYLESDQYVEKVAREDLNLVKPGDRAVLILAGDRPSTPPNPAARADDRTVLRDGPAGLWRDLIERFLGSGESAARPVGRP